MAGGNGDMTGRDGAWSSRTRAGRSEQYSSDGRRRHVVDDMRHSGHYPVVRTRQASDGKRRANRRGETWWACRVTPRRHRRRPLRSERACRGRLAEIGACQLPVWKTATSNGSMPKIGPPDRRQGTAEAEIAFPLWKGDKLPRKHGNPDGGKAIRPEGGKRCGMNLLMTTRSAITRRRVSRVKLWDPIEDGQGTTRIVAPLTP